MTTVWITGASSGIGEQLAREFASCGHAVVMLARRGDILRSLRDELLLKYPEKHRIIEVDVCNHLQFMALAAEDVSTHGLPDIVVANAGISRGTSVEYPEDFGNFEAILRTNVLAMYSTFAAFAGPMKARGTGTLVGISSVAGVRGLPGSEAYSASKAAATSLCESVRLELRGSGVRVVTIAPGFIKTPMTDVNPYPMPFLMPATRFARKAADAIVAGRSYTVLPWQMAWVARLLRVMPDGIYDRLMSRTGRKPRSPSPPA